MMLQKWYMFAKNVLWQRKIKWCTTFHSVPRWAHSLGYLANAHYLREIVLNWCLTLCTSIHSLNFSIFSLMLLMKVELLQQYGTATILTLKTGNFQRFKASFSKTLKHTDVLSVKCLNIRSFCNFVEETF